MSTLLHKILHNYTNCNRPNNLALTSIWALSRSIHATTSFDAAVAVAGDIYSRAMNSLPHRN